MHLLQTDHVQNQGDQPDYVVQMPWEQKQQPGNPRIARHFQGAGLRSSCSLLRFENGVFDVAVDVHCDEPENCSHDELPHQPTDVAANRSIMRPKESDSGHAAEKSETS